jgi:transposase-like protein
MISAGYKHVNICKELDIHPSTLRRWLRKEGIKAKEEPEEPKKLDVVQDVLDKELEKKTDDAIKIAKHDARKAEDEAMMEIAESQSSPAEKYQSYIAAAGIKLLRDSVKNLRGPKTVRELSELDQLIRRNLGLNAKNAGGAGKVQIDISILHNTKADRGNGSIKIKDEDIIDAEEAE